MLVYISEDPDEVRQLLKKRLPVVYLEGPGSETVYEAPYVWQYENVQDRQPDEQYLERVWRRHKGLPWLIAETERLLIRESVMEDLPAFLQMYEEEAENPDVQKWGENPKEQLQQYISSRYPLMEYGLWTAVKKDTGEVIGRVGVEDQNTDECELSYLIRRADRRCGYALEAAEAVLRYMKEEFPGHKILVRTSEGNEASKKTAQKLGIDVLVIDLSYR